MSDPARPDWDTYFLGVAKAVAQRADCRRRRVGAVLVSAERRVLSTGYNGAPPGHPGCLEGHCPRGLLTYEQVRAASDYDTGPGRCISVHAEVNAVLFARTDLRGTTCYVTHQPCPSCRKVLLGAGVARAVWSESLDGTHGIGSEDYVHDVSL